MPDDTTLVSVRFDVVGQPGPTWTRPEDPNALGRLLPPVGWWEPSASGRPLAVRVDWGRCGAREVRFTVQAPGERAPAGAAWVPGTDDPDPHGAWLALVMGRVNAALRVDVGASGVTLGAVAREPGLPDIEGAALLPLQATPEGPAGRLIAGIAAAVPLGADGALTLRDVSVAVWADGSGDPHALDLTAVADLSGLAAADRLAACDDATLHGLRCQTDRVALDVRGVRLAPR